MPRPNSGSCRSRRCSSASAGWCANSSGRRARRSRWSSREPRRRSTSSWPTSSTTRSSMWCATRPITGSEPPEERRAAGKPETGRIVLAAAQAGSEVRISVSDDGRGLSRPKILKRARARPLRSRRGARARDPLEGDLRARLLHRRGGDEPLGPRGGDGCAQRHHDRPARPHRRRQPRRAGQRGLAPHSRLAGLPRLHHPASGRAALCAAHRRGVRDRAAEALRPDGRGCRRRLRDAEAPRPLDPRSAGSSGSTARHPRRSLRRRGRCWPWSAPPQASSRCRSTRCSTASRW